MAAYQAEADVMRGPAIPVPVVYAWVVFALTFGLLISDYMSRQVLNAVFPLLKTEWRLSDTQLGSLSGVVSLMVGLLTFPLSLVAERVGRVKSITVMALLWSLATLGCAVSRDFDQMLHARFLVGIGEAAYGSVGVALVLSIFPVNMRATLTGAFMAGGTAGSVLGIALGGVVAERFGWRIAFGGMAALGLVLALLYPFVVAKVGRAATAMAALSQSSARGLPTARTYARRLATLVGSRSVLCAYAGSGLQLFVISALIAWMPSWLNRYHHLPTARAGVLAAGLVLASGLGMVFWGVVSDGLSRAAPTRKATLAILICLVSSALLLIGFRLPPGPVQLIIVAAGLFVASGAVGPSGAMVANLTDASVHGAAFALLTLANNLLGLAPGPIVTGALADRIGLDAALQWIPLVSLVAAIVFLVARGAYGADLRRTASPLASA